MTTKIFARFLFTLGIFAVGFYCGNLANEAEKESEEGSKSNPKTSTQSVSSIRSDGSVVATVERRVVEEGDLSVAQGDPLPGFLAKFDGDAVKAWSENLSLAEVQLALEKCRSAPPGEGPRRTAWFLLRRWATLDPENAWAAASALPGETSPGYFLGAVAGEVAKTSLDQAFSLAMRLGVGNARNNVISEIADEAGKLNLVGTVAFWNAHPELPTSDSALTDVIRRVAKSDLALAASVVGQISNPEAQKSAAISIANLMAETDVEEALRWAAQFRNPEIVNEVREDLIRQQAKEDPHGAMAAAAAITDSNSRRSTQANVISQWLATDFQGAIDYLSSTGDPKLLEWGAAFQVADTLRSATTAEIESVLNQFPSGTIRDELGNVIARQSINEGDYSKAVEMLNLLPDSASRDRAVSNMAEEWARNNGAAAAAWLKAQPDSTDRDFAVGGYSQGLISSSPQDAAQWVMSIQDPEIRLAAVRNMGLQWMKRMPPLRNAGCRRSTFSNPSSSKTCGEWPPRGAKPPLFRISKPAGR